MMFDRIPKTKRALLGAGAGIGASLAMGAFMLGAQRAGPVGKLPPLKITQRAFDRLGVSRSRATDEVATLGAHLAYGGATGALYHRALRGRVLPRQPVAEGMLFGAFVWVVSYFGWVPALRFMPPPTRDRPARSATMLAAHLVFGAVLGALGPRRVEGL